MMVVCVVYMPAFWDRFSWVSIDVHDGLYMEQAQSKCDDEFSGSLYLYCTIFALGLVWLFSPNIK